jgi:transcriptional regulator with GAF, ATPase, and Fis domain
MRAFLARARLALARESFGDALRALERAARIARDEGIGDDAAEIQSLRKGVDSAIARLGDRPIGSFTEFNQLIHGLRLLDDPPTSLKRLVEVAREWTGADTALLVLETGQDAWEPFHVAGAAAGERDLLVDLGTRAARLMAAEGNRPLASTDPSADARLSAGLPPGTEAGPILAAPLVAEGRVAGALVVAHRARAGQFAPEAFPFLVALSTVASSISSDLRGEEMRRENILLRQKLGLEGGFESFITQNARMLEIIDTLKRAAGGSTTVLLQGETGTGKELLARALHQHGLAQRSGRFVTVCCSELSQGLLESELFGHIKGSFTGAAEEKKGLFQVADGGTVFIDQIDKTNRDFQELLLRVVDKREIKPVGSNESRVVDVRIICASNTELKRAVEEGRFLKDLYYRLRVIALVIPPLRARSEDIPLLAEHFLRLASRRFRLTLRGF